MLSVRSRVSVAVACAAALAAGFVAAGPAGASAKQMRNATGGSAHSSLHVLPHGGVQPDVLPKTRYGAGYFSYPGAGNVASASVTFKMPSISCHKNTDSEWLSPGIWVYNASGTLTQFSGVEFNCNNGAFFMGDVICVDTYTACDDSLPVSPGDRVEASLSESSTSTVATVRNLTTGNSVQISGPATTADQTVFLGDVGPSIANPAVTHVPTFTSVAFTKAQVNGQYLGDWGPSGYRLATNGGVLQETTGPLTGDHDAFRTTFVHN